MPSSPSSLPNKKDVARALLLKGSVFVHLDPRSDSVAVPPWFKRQPQLVLQIGLDMRPTPIPDLRVDDSGVFGTLSFNRTGFTCVVPWAAVFAVVGDDGRGMVWPASMPPEIAAEVEREARRTRGPAAEAGAIEEVARERKGDSAREHTRENAQARPRRARRKRTLGEPSAKPSKLKRPAFEVIAGAAEPAEDGPLKLRERGPRPSYLKLVK